MDKIDVVKFDIIMIVCKQCKQSFKLYFDYDSSDFLQVGCVCVYCEKVGNIYSSFDKNFILKHYLV